MSHCTYIKRKAIAHLDLEGPFISDRSAKVDHRLQSMHLSLDDGVEVFCTNGREGKEVNGSDVQVGVLG